MPHSTDAHWLGSWQNFLHCSFQVSLPSLPPFLWLLPLFCLALLFPPIFPSPSLFLSVPPSPPSIPCWISVSSCGCDMTYSPEIKCIRNEPTSVSYSFCVFLIFLATLHGRWNHRFLTRDCPLQWKYSLNHWISREVSSNSFDYSKVKLTLWQALRGQPVLDTSEGLCCRWPGSEGDVLILWCC